MATNDQLKALVQSHGEGDDSQFYSVAMQVAAKAARGGQSKFAQELRELVDQLRAREGARAQIAAVLPFTQQSPHRVDLHKVEPVCLRQHGWSQATRQARFSR